MLSAYWVNGERRDVSDADMRTAVKSAAATLLYPEKRGIPIDKIDKGETYHLGYAALAIEVLALME